MLLCKYKERDRWEPGRDEDYKEMEIHPIKED